LVRQRFGADCNTDISGFNDVLKKPLRGFKNSRIVQRLKYYFEGSFYCRKTLVFSCGSFNADFFYKIPNPA
jgi:hypothetical protein